MKTSIHRVYRLLILSGMAGSGVSTLRAQIEYTTDGIPTAGEEEVRWHVNRARFDRTGENNTRGTSYNDIPVSSGPLAPHNSLTLAARHHTEDMAKNNKFQHDTVPGSPYYNPTLQKDPWQRFLAEGYVSLGGWAENISTGLAAPEATYVAWWNSTEHRQNMGNSTMQEIGTGYYFQASSGLAHFWTLDLAWGAPSFFTDTMFLDANGNSKYTQGEGISGVRVSIRINGVEFPAFDVSAAPGSFAIPLSGLGIGPVAEIWLANQTATAVTLSIPRDYRTLELVTLAPGQSIPTGTFARPSTGVNFGFRNLVKSTGSVTAPVLTLTKTGGTSQISWPSQTGLQYQPQWSANLNAAWTDFAGGYKNGTGGVMTQADAATTSRKYYRVVVRKP